ncbi:NTP transferase domain-containing protein [Streptomyces triticiradicis]|uniref:NTP transferase domain-containing protein n=1 Tax=Streptomyces triticiradicis TaxID=2651189 RepID=A0A7J5DM43_9ACTN|nr:NTP transferase domain-containing protein [Streptomyces triticiradicis]KAB1989796.1 NTP transferase domain-containing protein [Streptomyces triticiradicis]
MSTKTAVLLAAGHGTRLGRDKPSLPFGSETLLARHIRQARLAGVTEFVVVAGRHNEDRVREIAAAVPDPQQIEVVLQKGPDAHAAAATGLERITGRRAAFVCGITDLVPDNTYATMTETAVAPGVTIAAFVLEHTFVGGMLDFHPGTLNLRRIVERPPGGCPPGRLVNIWIHHLAGGAFISEIAQATRQLGDYEEAINQALAKGSHGMAHIVSDWEAVKDETSLGRARERFHPQDPTAAA